MRSDSIGLFWEDVAKVKPPKKEKIKRIPPKRFWEEPGYLPPGALEEARAYQFVFMNDMELIAAAHNKERLIYDIEVYPNYALFAFKSVVSGKLIMFELDDAMGYDFDDRKLKWILEHFTIITFNGRGYDLPISALAVDPKYGVEDFWAATLMLIQDDLRPYQLYKKFGVKEVECDQIDIFQLTALAPSLKKCAARLHAKRLQDLPFKPGTYLTPDQIIILRRYNVNDLDNTQLVYESKIPEIELREKTGLQYNVDLRSESDAQMAEAIINAEIKRISGRKYIQKTKIAPGTAYKYTAPKFIKFSTPLMNWVVDLLHKATFVVSDSGEGGIDMPPELKDFVITIAEGHYKLGIGGLHSQESRIAHVADEEYFIADTDAASYYPRLILNAGLTPKNLGQDFLIVYNGIVITRLKGKELGDIVTAESLKIVINGAFGKLNSMYSIMFAPDLMLQVTITGQLSLLMLVERFELAGIQVTSANTDGIVVKCKRSMESVFKDIVKQWQKETGFDTEEVRYKGTYNKDVNNYIIEYEKAQKGEKFKLKGLYSKTNSKKNAVNEICILALKNYMDTGKPVEETIRECTQISMFTTMRFANGGAVKDDKYLGSIVRWYYSTETQGEIINAKTGNRVARTEGAVPLMDLPDEIPNDLDYDWYINEAYSIIEKIEYRRPALQAVQGECVG